MCRGGPASRVSSAKARAAVKLVASRRNSTFRFIISILFWGRCLLECAQVAVVQRRFAQQSDQDQGAYATPGDEQEAVDDAQAVRLQAQSRRNQIDRASTSSRDTGRLRGQPCSRGANVLIRNPIARADVESQEVRMQFFPLSNEMPHVDSACGSAKQTNGLEESRKCKGPLRFRQASGEDRLQHDAGNEADEGKSLSHSGQQLGAIEVWRRPCAGVLRIEPG